MKYQFFWDEPTSSVISFFFQFSTTLITLAAALTLAFLARRRVLKAGAGAQAIPADPGLEGQAFASKILEAAQVSGWSIIRGRGPLANFIDPPRRELRLSETIADGRTLNALAIATRQAGQVLRDPRGSWLARGRVTLILAAKLASGSAWLALLAGALMLSPYLTDRGALLYAGALLVLLSLQPIEALASRRALRVIRQGNLDAGWTDADRKAFETALKAARWAEIAATLPGFRG